jgi:hypothetical protein
MSSYFRKLIRVLIILSAAFIFLPTTITHAADQDMFDVYNLEVEGYILGFITGEFNNDGLTDLVIIYSPHNDQYIRHLGLYLQKSPGNFRPRSDYLITLANSSVQIDAGDIDNDNMDEILVIDNNGVNAIDYSEASGLSQPIRLIETRTVYTTPYMRGIITEPFIYNITDRPGNELLVPALDGFAIYEFDGNGSPTLLKSLAAPLACHFPREEINPFTADESREIHLILPKLHIADGNLDGRSDIYFLWENRVCCFFQDNNGSFAATPSFTQQSAIDYQTGFIQSRLTDINGDRHPDLLVLSTSGGLTGTETRLRSYLSNNQGLINSEYTDEISLSDSYSNLIINDFNADNNSEIIIPSIEMGAFAATKMLLTKKSDMHLLIYSIDEGHLRNVPKKRIKYEFKFNFADLNPAEEVSIDWMGNYNSDALLDAVFCDGNGQIQFFWGHGTEYLSKTADLEILMDHPSDVHPIHLNRGRNSDLIVEHNLSGRYDRISVLINKNN